MTSPSGNWPKPSAIKKGEITFDPSQPDGTPHKLMDGTRLNTLGWQAKIGLEQGLDMACQDFLAHG